jgi:hypothetical protein
MDHRATFSPAIGVSNILIIGLGNKGLSAIGFKTQTMGYQKLVI